MPSHVDEFSDGLARAIPPASDRDGPGPAGTGALANGAVVGRYVIEAAVGDGRRDLHLARDTSLDREVVLELFHVRGEAAGRLLREARTLARLAHPNVVTVLEVGEHDGAVFIAFDRLAGEPVARWLEADAPSVDEIRRVFRDAALGLAAAHEVGLVHGDLAADSILVDRDGRVRVTFGAGGRLGAALPPLDAGAEGSVDSARFPAPELGRGEAPTQASDQFSLAALLRDAVQRARNRVEGSPQLRRLRLALGRLRVPGRVARALDRALAVEPAQRWPSMAALARALELPHRRISVALAAAVALAALSGGALALSIHPGGGDDDACGWVGGALDGAWDPAQRARVTRAFGAAGAAEATAAASTVRTLDRYAASWVDQRRSLCRSGPASGETERRAALTGACLARRREALGALVTELAGADAGRLRNAVEAATSLPPVEECAHGQLVVAGAASVSPAQRVQLARLTAELDRLDARQALGDTTVSGRVREIAAQAARLGDHSLASSAWMTVALSSYDTAEPGARLDPLYESLWAAESAGDLVATLVGWIRLVENGSAASLPRPEVERMLGHAQATLARIARVDPAIANRYRAQLLAAQAEIADEYGSSAEAEKLERQAIALFTAASRGEPTLEIANAEHSLGQILISASRYDEAIEVSTRALARTRALVGDDHPNTMSRHYQLGWAYFMRGRFDPALVEVAACRGIAARLGARVYLGKLAILEAQIEQKRDRPEAARAALERAIADGSAEALSPFQVHYYLGEIEINLSDFAAAEQHFRQALEAIMAVNPDDMDVSFARAGIGMALLQGKRPAEARPFLEAAVTDMARREQSERPLAEMRRMLAEALWATGQHTRARAVAGQVRQFLATLPADLAGKDLADIDTWLAEHGEGGAGRAKSGRPADRHRASRRGARPHARRSR